MIRGLPLTKKPNQEYEGFLVHKQHRDIFHKGNSWRASKPLELVH